MAKQSTGPQNRRTSTPGTRPTTRATSTRRAPSTRRRTAQANVTFGFPWTKQNIIGICAGVAVIILGYVLMGTGITSDVAHNDGIWNNTNSITIAPILLAIGYCVIIPYFIFRRFNNGEEGGSEV